MHIVRDAHEIFGTLDALFFLGAQALVLRAALNRDDVVVLISRFGIPFCRVIEICRRSVSNHVGCSVPLSSASKVPRARAI